MTDAEGIELLRQYFQAKAVARGLKDERNDLHGTIDNNRGCGSNSKNGEGECYMQHGLDYADWCDFCKERQEIHNKYHEALKYQQSLWMKLYRQYGKATAPTGVER